MPINKSSFVRRFQSIPNTNPKSSYPYLPSEKDNLESELDKKCINLELNLYHWFENNSLTQIRITRNPYNLEPEYEKRVFIETMGINNHPEGLLDILRQLEFQKI